MPPMANDVVMNWLDLFAIIPVLGHTLWLAGRGWRLFKSLLNANTISDVLKSILEQHHFYFVQGVGSFAALVLFLGVKSLFLLIAPAEETILNPVVFGSFASRFLPGKLGCVGMVLLVISIVCFYQHIKCKHYLHVLYAFRNQLGLTESS